MKLKRGHRPFSCTSIQRVETQWQDFDTLRRRPFTVRDCESAGQLRDRGMD